MNLLSLKARTIYSLRPYSLTFNARMRNIRSHWIFSNLNEPYERASERASIGVRVNEWVSELVMRLFWCVVRLQTHTNTRVHARIHRVGGRWRWRQQHWQKILCSSDTKRRGAAVAMAETATVAAAVWLTANTKNAHLCVDYVLYQHTTRGYTTDNSYYYRIDTANEQVKRANERFKRQNRDTRLKCETAN